MTFLLDFGGIYSVVLLVSHTILSGCISNLSPFLLDCLHNRQMTPNNSRHAAKEPAPMAIPITSGGTNVGVSNFFTEILAADMPVIVVVLLGVDVVLIVGGAVVLLGRASVVLLAGEAAVLLVVTEQL